MSTIHDTIHDQVTKHPVVLYMKGTPQFPQCGFSATVAEILKRCGVDRVFLGQRPGRRRDPPGHQGIRELADDPAALRQRRVRRRLRHRARDVRDRRAAEGAVAADGLIRRTAYDRNRPEGPPSSGPFSVSRNGRPSRTGRTGQSSCAIEEDADGSTEGRKRHAVHPAGRDHGARDARRIRVPGAGHRAQEEPGQRAGQDPRRLRGVDDRVFLHRLRGRLRRRRSSPAPSRWRRRTATSSSSSSSC